MAPLWINCNLRVTQAYQLSCPVHLLFADSESFQIYICVYFQNIIIFSPCLAHTHISWIYNGSNWLTLAKPKGKKYFVVPLWFLWNLIKDLSDNCLDISMHQINFLTIFPGYFLPSLLRHSWHKLCIVWVRGGRRDRRRQRRWWGRGSRCTPSSPSSGSHSLQSHSSGLLQLAYQDENEGLPILIFPHF